MAFKIDTIFVVRANKRIQQQEEWERDLAICLKAKVCPKCGADLQLVVEIYKCISETCGFEWDQNWSRS